MGNIQHTHTVSSRVREALRLTTERSASIEYEQPQDIIDTEAEALRTEVELLNSIAHELLEALALL